MIRPRGLRSRPLCIRASGANNKYCEPSSKQKTMLQVIETATTASSKPTIDDTIGVRKLSRNGTLSSPFPPTTVLSAHGVTSAALDSRKLGLDTATTPQHPLGSSVLIESSTSSTCTATDCSERNNSTDQSRHPPSNCLFYPAIVTMSQQEEYPVIRPSRESVLQRLSEALLRRSLQKVGR